MQWSRRGREGGWIAALSLKFGDQRLDSKLADQLVNTSDVEIFSDFFHV